MSEASKGFIANNWFKLFIVALSLFLIALYFHRESQLDTCLEHASVSYKKSWEFQCKQQKKDGDCSLPRILADSVEKDREKQADECFRRFSFK